MQELEDPIYAAEILTNKKRIIEVRPIFILVLQFCTGLISNHVSTMVAYLFSL